MRIMPKNGEKTNYEIFEPYLNPITEKNCHLDPIDIGLVKDAPPEAVEAFKREKESQDNMKKAGAV